MRPIPRPVPCSPARSSANSQISQVAWSGPSRRRSTSRPPSRVGSGTCSRPGRSPRERQMTDRHAPAPAVLTPGSDFPVTWPDASDAELTWEFDGMHTPSCLAPLAWDYGHVVGQGFGYRYDRLGLPVEVRSRV